MTTPELARLAKVSPQYVHLLHRRGALPAPTREITWTDSRGKVIQMRFWPPEAVKVVRRQLKLGRTRSREQLEKGDGRSRAVRVFCQIRRRWCVFTKECSGKGVCS